MTELRTGLPGTIAYRPCDPGHPVPAWLRPGFQCSLSFSLIAVPRWAVYGRPGARARSRR